ncbi:MAG: toxin TcdB middle/N-terminal domain-containing protein [Candidatus Omnitrophica bacterium]|nr:toxin TcdB middle/N-terminal domain-containing protein [Candidatus Omnitrophota bacterium]
MRKFISIILVFAHVALILPLPEAHAMESANFKVTESAVSSGGGSNGGIGADIAYSNAAEPATGNAESSNYKASLGYINVIASNPPIFKSLIPDANMRAVWDKAQPCATTISLDGYFSSPDNLPLTYIVEGNSRISAVVNPVTHVVNFSQGDDFSGAEAVRFVAVDASGNRTVSNFVMLVVKGAGNNPPVIHPISDITVRENELVQVAPTVFDPDGDALTITYSAPLNDTGSWQTSYKDSGAYKITATVSDGTLKASSAFNITVKNVNRPPVIDTIAGVTVNEGDVVKLNVTARDPDGDNVTIDYPNPLDSDGSWQTTYKDAGSYSFTVTASDGDLSSTSEANVTVNPINAAPLVRLYSDKTSLSANEEFTVYLLAQDPDGDQLTLTLKKDGSAISGCENIVLDAQTFTKTISISNAGSHTIDAVVTETGVSGDANTASATLKINVDENSSSDVYFPISGDFNGDGLTDLGYFNRALGIWKVQLSKGDGTFGSVEYWIASGFGNNDSYCYPMTGDFNGDGKTDAGFIRVPTSDGAGSYVRLALSSGTAFSAQTTDWRSTSAGTLMSDWHYTTFTGDFNGDGISDTGQVHYEEANYRYVGLTGANGAVSAMENWIKGGSHVSTGEISPIAADFNGDGLTDACFFRKAYGTWTVCLSKGDRFGDTTTWLTVFGTDKDPVLADFNCDGLTDIGYMVKEDSQWSVKYAISDGTKFNLKNGEAYTYKTLISDSVSGTFISGDFNGDGLFDIAVFNKDTREWTVKLHHSKYPDLLIGIDNGMSGTTTITYKDSAVFDNTGDDGLPTLPFSIRVVTSVTQSDGLGSNYTANYFYRDGAFDSVQREFRGFGYVKVIDAEGSYKETYFNQDDIYKGRPSKEVVRDKYNNIYSQVLYNWQDRKLFSDAVDYPYLLDKTSNAYDPVTGATKSAKTIYTYDDYGNAVNVREEGFLDTAGDEQEAQITYYYDTANWILSKPVESRVKDAAGNVAAATKYEYYSDGALKKEERWLGRAGGAPSWGSGDNPTAEFTYSAVGNVETVKDARGSVTATAYDATMTFPVIVTNALGHTQQFTYNKATGKILTSTDPNGQVSSSQYDGFGRLYHVAGPGNISEVAYTYDLASTPTRIISATKTADGSYAKAFSFIDGLGRQILSRSEAEYSGAAKHIVSGEVRYNSRGQVVRKYLPYYISVPAPEDLYMPPQNATCYVAYEYDAMGRLVKTIRPDNKVSYTIYGVNKLEAVNENGQRAAQTKDAYGRIVEVQEDMGDITNYVYDMLGNLTDTYDSASTRNHVHMEYDTLGRKILMTDPDMGGFAGKSWQYYYDRAGNLVNQVDAKGQSITFQYDVINRLVKKWGLSPQGAVPIFSVDYFYDDSSKPNCIGRLSSVTDPSGSTEFFYDILGREIKTTKNIGTSSYSVERSYDSLDRLVTVKYPDSTVIAYVYNKQGGIATVTGEQGASYVSSVSYNANGQIEHIVYGNGTSTDYAYDPYNFRLDQLKTFDPQKTAIQNLAYNFDPIGNVTSIQDSVNTNTQSFQYDNLNRLIQATGNSYGQINYTYDSIGNILTKGAIRMEYGANAGAHAVTAYTLNDVRKTIVYDHNGNMTAKGNSSFEYDIENRLNKVMVEKGGELFDLSLNLAVGWNFFSLPGFIPNTAGKIKDVLASIDGKYDQVSTYDPVTGKWLHYVGDEKFNQFDKFEIGIGYLIYVKEACTLSLSGSFPATAQVSQLKTGWNLVSAPTTSEIEPSEAFRNITYDSIVEYNGTEYIHDPATLKKGNAYWLHVTSDQAWTVPLSQVETTYSYDGDGGRVLRTSPSLITDNLGGCAAADNLGGCAAGASSEVGKGQVTVYVGSSYEAEGPAGQSPDKITKYIYMGSTRICSVETSLRAAEGGSSGVVKAYYYHADHIGSSNVVTDETGSVVNILEYSPFGEVSRNTGNYSTDKRFTGKIYDEGSALYYYGARYYDPELGRFITADTVIAYPYDPQCFNRYSYARNNPIVYIDPSGHFWWFIIWAICQVISAIAAVVSAVCTVASMISSAAGNQALANTFSSIAQIAGWVSIGAGLTAIGAATAAESAAAGVAANTSQKVVSETTIYVVRKSSENSVEMGLFYVSHEVPAAIQSSAVSAVGSLVASGVGAGSAVINSAMSGGSTAGNAFGNANAPGFYKDLYPGQYRTQLSAGEIGIGYKGAGIFYHTGLEAKSISGESAIIDFNRAPGANNLDTLLGKDVPGKFGGSENYQFYLVVDNNSTKVNAFFDIAAKLHNTDHSYNLYGTGKPFNCYEGRDWVLEQLKIKNNVRWRNQ